MGLVNSKQAAHAAASSVAALQAKNPTGSADSQVKSAAAPSEGLVWDEEMLAAWRSARPVIASVLAGRICWLMWMMCIRRRFYGCVSGGISMTQPGARSECGCGGLLNLLRRIMFGRVIGSGHESV